MFLFFALSNPKCKQIMSFCLKLQLCPYLFTQVPQCVHKSNNTTQKENSPKKKFMLTLPISYRSVQKITSIALYRYVVSESLTVSFAAHFEDMILKSSLKIFKTFLLVSFEPKLVNYF